MYLIAILHIPGIIITTLLWVIYKEDKFVHYHFAQIILLWIVSYTLYFIGKIASIMFMSYIIWALGGLFFVVMIGFGMYNAINGKLKPLPIIGELSKKFKF